MSCSVVAASTGSPEAALAWYPDYAGLVDRLDRHLAVIPGEHRRALAATALARACMQTPVIGQTAVAWPQALAPDELREINVSDGRLPTLYRDPAGPPIDVVAARPPGRGTRDLADRRPRGVPGRRVHRGRTVHGIYLVLGPNPTGARRAVAFKVSGQTGAWLAVADDVGIQLLTGELADLPGIDLRMTRADWTGVVPALRLLLLDVLRTESYVDLRALVDHGNGRNHAGSLSQLPQHRAVVRADARRSRTLPPVRPGERVPGR